jgi:hypothetical protein
MPSAMARRGRKPIDLVGQRFGLLTVVGRDPERPSYWTCCCGCGRQLACYTQALRVGSRTSCGCRPQRAKHDLAGKRFGRLFVIAPHSNQNGRRWMWRCRCDCGTIKVFSSQALRITHSCGCQRREKMAVLGRSHRKIDSDGLVKIQGLRAQGWTYQRIGSLYGVTKQAIHLLLSEKNG